MMPGITPEQVQSLFALAIGFAMAGVIATGYQVITSRLHGMIFALLLGKRVRYLDNLYGKLNGYASTWFDASVPVEPYRYAGSAA